MGTSFHRGSAYDTRGYTAAVAAPVSVGRVGGGPWDSSGGSSWR